MKGLLDTINEALEPKINEIKKLCKANNIKLSSSYKPQYGDCLMWHGKGYKTADKARQYCWELKNAGWKEITNDRTSYDGGESYDVDKAYLSPDEKLIWSFYDGGWESGFWCKFKLVENK